MVVLEFCASNFMFSRSLSESSCWAVEDSRMDRLQRVADMKGRLVGAKEELEFGAMMSACVMIRYEEQDFVDVGFGMEGLKRGRCK